MKVPDNVTTVPALLYWSHTTTAVDSGNGVGEPCVSAASLFDCPAANDLFFGSMAELPLLCCPSASEITKTARSTSTYNAPRIRCVLIVELMFAFTLLTLRCANIFYSKRVKAAPRNEFNVFATTPCRGLSLSR